MNEERFNLLKKESAQGNKEIKELEDYRVDNAIILAAGKSSDTMYAPPKGLLLVDGIPIIERQVCQLIEAGIKEIYIVVGYKKEMYFYLEDKYDEVVLIGNRDRDVSDRSAVTIFNGNQTVKLFSFALIEGMGNRNSHQECPSAFTQF